MEFLSTSSAIMDLDFFRSGRVWGMRLAQTGWNHWSGLIVSFPFIDRFRSLQLG